MARQLRLLEAPEDDWRLDDETRRVGLKGVAAAREALREAARRRPRRADPDDASPAAA
jgi:hypothetical protein